MFDILHNNKHVNLIDRAVSEVSINAFCHIHYGANAENFHNQH